MSIELVISERAEWWFCPECEQILTKAKGSNAFEWVECPECEEVGEKRDAVVEMEPAY